MISVSDNSSYKFQAFENRSLKIFSLIHDWCKKKVYFTVKIQLCALKPEKELSNLFWNLPNNSVSIFKPFDKI
jgi:hypothetical protein